MARLKVGLIEMGQKRIEDAVKRLESLQSLPVRFVTEKYGAMNARGWTHGLHATGCETVHQRLGMCICIGQFGHADDGDKYGCNSN